MGSTNKNDTTPMLDIELINELPLSSYKCDYTIKFDENSNLKAWINEKGFVNILRIYND